MRHRAEGINASAPPRSVKTSTDGRVCLSSKNPYKQLILSSTFHCALSSLTHPFDSDDALKTSSSLLASTTSFHFVSPSFHFFGQPGPSSTNQGHMQEPPAQNDFLAGRRGIVSLGSTSWRVTSFKYTPLAFRSCVLPVVANVRLFPFFIPSLSPPWTGLANAQE
ncbi:hypothetical protein F5887DRAFT_29097 [Amanita rubescens]|nr:hypothetical protein F5887DRAFT_29097 [Amanita rubescens]